MGGCLVHEKKTKEQIYGQQKKKKNKYKRTALAFEVYRRY